MCACAPGFAREAAEMPCEPVMGSVIGEECSAEMACSAPYPYCATLSDQSFCTTQDCTVNADCPLGFNCHADGANKFCAEPVGWGKSCQAPADCAGGEATFCESFVSHTCIVEKCATNPSVCPSGNVCCDLSSLIGASLCVTESGLMNGKCADGKAPVSP
jgi:hypothetical protein